MPHNRCPLPFFSVGFSFVRKRAKYRARRFVVKSLVVLFWVSSLRCNIIRMNAICLESVLQRECIRHSFWWGRHSLIICLIRIDSVRSKTELNTHSEFRIWWNAAEHCLIRCFGKYRTYFPLCTNEAFVRFATPHLLPHSNVDAA